MDWEDLKYFLAVARTGSIRKASTELKVNHTTVSRHINSLEEDLGVRLFERLPSGYACTPAGEDMREEAIHLERKVFDIERKITGLDSEMSGLISLTMPDVIASHLLLPDIKDFTFAHPNIELEMVISYQTLSLNRREADVAIRITNNPPEELIGRKLGHYKVAAYVNRQIAEEFSDEEIASRYQWIGWENEERYPTWVKNSPYPDTPIKHFFNHAGIQLKAVISGMGIGMLPCFIADQEPELVRIGNNWIRSGYDIWMLIHPDLRQTRRVREFMTWIHQRFEKYQPLLAGEMN